MSSYHLLEKINEAKKLLDDIKDINDASARLQDMREGRATFKAGEEIKENDLVYFDFQTGKIYKAVAEC